MAYIRTLLISTQDLKSNTVIENNLEDHVILPNIINTHVVDLYEVLGCDFYDYLLEAVRNETTNADEDKLIDRYIIPFLIQQSLYRCLPYLWSKMENSSIIVKETETHKSLDLEQLKYLRGDIMKDANFIKQRLIEYLCENANLFPEYNNFVVKSAYSNIGIYLDPSEDDCDFYD